MEIIKKNKLPVIFLFLIFQIQSLELTDLDNLDQGGTNKNQNI